jgi:excisionase family DNA binding protein
MTNNFDRMTVPELAKRLRTSAATVLRLIRSGDLRGINIGAGNARPRYIVRADDLERFERERATAPVPTLPRPRRQAAAVPNYFAKGATL